MPRPRFFRSRRMASYSIVRTASFMRLPQLSSVRACATRRRSLKNMHFSLLQQVDSASHRGELPNGASRSRHHDNWSRAPQASALFYAGCGGASAQMSTRFPRPAGQPPRCPGKINFDVGGLRKDTRQIFGFARSSSSGPVQIADPLQPHVTALEEGDRTLHRSSPGANRLPDARDRDRRGPSARSNRGASPAAPADAWYVRPRNFRRVSDPASHRARALVIIGGGRFGVRLAHQLRDARRASLSCNRSDRIARMRDRREVRSAAGPVRLRSISFQRTHDVIAEGDRIVRSNSRTSAKSTRRIEADVGSDAGYVQRHRRAGRVGGLQVEERRDHRELAMETGRAVVYCGPATSRRNPETEAHRDRFGEAATAVNQAVHHIYREESDPGPSSNLAIFRQKEDLELESVLRVARALLAGALLVTAARRRGLRSISPAAPATSKGDQGDVRREQGFPGAVL